MNPKNLFLSLIIIAVFGNFTLHFGQEPAADIKLASDLTLDLKLLRELNDQILKVLRTDNDPPEGYVRVEYVREIAIKWQKKLDLSTVSVTLEKTSTALPSDTRKNVLRSLSTLISDLVENSYFESPHAAILERKEQAARQINAIIEFTDPKQLEIRKTYPLDVKSLLYGYSKQSPEISPQAFSDRALILVQKRCVDFVDDGTTYWALRMVGASESLLKEIDFCVTPERKAVIANRNAAMSVEDVNIENATIVGDVFRILFGRKDLVNQKRAIEAGREFLRRFGDWEGARELTEYLKTQLPKMEAKVSKEEATTQRPQ